MSSTPEPGRTGAPPQPSGGFRWSDTGRVEAFSDGVLAIAITILVLDLRMPEHPPGELATALLAQWPAYLGYLTSFAYIGVIWLNHHQAFTRIRYVDRGLHLANLALLFTTAALPFPTGVLAEALQHDLTGPDARVAVVLYALIAAAMCASWLALFSHLHHHAAALAEQNQRRFAQHGRIRSTLGILAYLAAGAIGYTVHPVIALIVFLLLPVFYGLTSEGFHRTTRR